MLVNMSHKDKIKDTIVPNLHWNLKNLRSSMRVLINIMKIKNNRIVPKVVKNKKYFLDRKVNILSKIH
jgi:formiminotetrahydrofolate cyclodeaminase